MCAFKVGVFLGINPAYYLQEGTAMELPFRRLVLSLDANLLGTVKEMNQTVYETLISCSSNQLYVLSRVFWTEPLMSKKKKKGAFIASAGGIAPLPGWESMGSLSRVIKWLE